MNVLLVTGVLLSSMALLTVNGQTIVSNYSDSSMRIFNGGVSGGGVYTTTNGVKSVVVDDGSGNVVLGGSTAKIGYSSARGNPALIGSPGNRAWWTVNDYSIPAGAPGGGASVQLSQNNTNYWEMYHSVGSAGSYTPASDFAAFWYDGGTGAKLQIYGNGKVTTAKTTLDDSLGNMQLAGGLIAPVTSGATVYAANTFIYHIGATFSLAPATNGAIIILICYSNAACTVNQGTVSLYLNGGNQGSYSLSAWSTLFCVAGSNWFCNS